MTIDTNSLKPICSKTCTSRRSIANDHDISLKTLQAAMLHQVHLTNQYSGLFSRVTKSFSTQGQDLMTTPFLFKLLLLLHISDRLGVINLWYPRGGVGSDSGGRMRMGRGNLHED